MRIRYHLLGFFLVFYSRKKMGGYTVLFMYFVEKETEILEEFMCFIESIFPQLHARSNAVGIIAAFPH